MIFGNKKEIYLDNADNLSYKERLTKELTFPRKVKSKSTALSIIGGKNVI